MGHQVTNAFQKGQEKKGCLASFPPFPLSLLSSKSAATPPTLHILVSVHTCIGFAPELRLLLEGYKPRPLPRLPSQA